MTETTRLQAANTIALMSAAIEANDRQFRRMRLGSWIPSWFRPLTDPLCGITRQTAANSERMLIHITYLLDLMPDLQTDPEFMSTLELLRTSYARIGFGYPEPHPRRFDVN